MGSDVLVDILLSLALVVAEISYRIVSYRSLWNLATPDIPEVSCDRSPVTAPTTASFLPPTRSMVPSAYPLA